MAKIFGILLLVLGVWIGMEIYTKGTHDAFGGALARFAAPIQPDRSTAYDRSDSSSADAPTERETRGSTVHGSLAQRVGVKVQTEINDSAARRGAAMGDEGDKD